MFNFKLILNVLGVLLIALSALMLLPVFVDLINSNQTWLSFFIASMFCLGFGISLFLSTRSGDDDDKFSIKDAFLLTTSSWLTIALFGAIPFYISEIGFSLTDAIFESMSGVTTTGSTIITELESMPEGILIWRSILQWLGGIGIIVMAISILPVLQVGGMQIFRTESSDTSDKILPRTTQVASAVLTIYLALTSTCAIAYWMFGMSVFDAINHSMTTIATGGFSTKSGSIGAFNSSGIDYVACLFMLLASLPILIYLQVYRGKFLDLFKDKQVTTFLLIILVSSFSVIFYLWLYDIKTASTAIQHGLFNVISIITGTGYSTDNYNLWGAFPIYLLFFGMFVGGCAGSTTCGIKVFRFQILFETTRNQIKKVLHPHGVFISHYNNKKLSDDVVTSVMSFFFVFILSFIVITLLLSTTQLDFVTSLSAAATSLANVGPGLGSTIGPEGNFYGIPLEAKWILILAMLIGRLELFTVLVLIMPQFWKK
ncbi:MAG: TrkH family potassium uptake protein [Candidatus Pelagibacterales bacterium]|jgi:trk system potassium uptake protein TrkH|tara:strand:- start:15792 stop:17246 length:1455 start_codon:yes stop_codon:yes gene_type:complete